MGLKSASAKRELIELAFGAWLPMCPLGPRYWCSVDWLAEVRGAAHLGCLLMFLGAVVRGLRLGWLVCVVCMGAYLGGKRSWRGILLGRGISIHSSLVGKYGRLFSGKFSSSWVLLLRNSGHSLSQLACVSVLHDTQCSFPLLLHWLVLRASLHVPQVSSFAKQLCAKWPQCLHFMHCMGSCFRWFGWIFRPQTYRPSLMQVLVMFMLLRVKIAWAARCSGERLLIGLIHRAFWMNLPGILLFSSISRRWESSAGSKVSGILGMRIEYSLCLIRAPGANAKVNAISMAVSRSHSTTSFSLKRIVIPPLRGLLTSSTVVSLGAAGSAMATIAALTLSLISARFAPMVFSSEVSMRIWRAFLSTSLATFGSTRGSLANNLCGCCVLLPMRASQYVVAVFSSWELVAVTFSIELPISVSEDLMVSAACPISFAALLICSCLGEGVLAASSRVSSLFEKSAFISVRRSESSSGRSFMRTHWRHCTSMDWMVSARNSSAWTTTPGTLYFASNNSTLASDCRVYGVLSDSRPFLSRKFLASLYLSACLARSEVSTVLLVRGLDTSGVPVPGVGCGVAVRAGPGVVVFRVFASG